MSELEPIRILYMEDDVGQARLLQKALERAGYVVTLARDGEEGLVMYDAGSYDVLAVDQNMPVHDGLDVIRILAARGPLPPIIMVTGTGSEEIAVEAMKLGARDYIVKDVEGRYLDLLPPVIRQVFQQQRLAEEKWQAEEALRQYAAELEARNEELDAFAHTVAHDLKDPLSTIIGFADVLQEAGPTLPAAELREYLQAMARSGQKMLSILEGLLLLAGVRKMQVEVSPLDMASIVAEVSQRLADIVEEHRADIILPAAWPTVVGYAPWVEEVWVNYLSNAIKYGGRPPRVELGAAPLSVPPAGGGGPPSIPPASGGEVRGGYVRFWVRDNGPGLSPEAQARLFTPFTRLDQARLQGYGLGLSIVRRIVEKLGGQVGVESQVGAGSTFWFTLPGAHLQ